MKKTISFILAFCLMLTLLPTFALAEGAAAINYLEITTDSSGNPTVCTYKGTTASDTQGILIENGTYTFASAYNGFIIVSNATVTYPYDIDLSRFGSSIYVFGTGSFSASNVTVSAGGYTNAYTGSNGAALLTFISGLRSGDTDYSYTLQANTALNNFLTAYDLTIPAEKTLTVNAPASGVGQPDHYRLTVTHALTVNGTLTAAAGQMLLIGENAAVSGNGLTLYDDNGTSPYTFAVTHNAEEFSFTNTGTEQAPVLRWVRQAQQPQQPQAPQYCVRYDSNAVAVTLGGAAFTDENQQKDYPALTEGADDLVFTFAAKETEQQGAPANEFYGVKKTVYGETTTVTYIKAGAAGLSETGSGTGVYTLTIAETDFDKSIEIEAVSQPMPFDGEYMLVYDENGSVSVGGTRVGSQTVNAFTAGTALSFTFTPPEGITAPYKVVVEPNGGSSQEQTVSGNTLSYTPGSTAGFVVYVYWTQAQYDFDTLNSGDGEFMVEYRWQGCGTVTHDAAGVVSSATYDNRTKVVLTNGTAGLALTLTPLDGHSVKDVFERGTQKTAGTDYQTSGGTYTMALDNGWSELEVYFTQEYTITASAGANGSISPAGSVTVAEGADQTFSFTPESGYAVNSIMVDGHTAGNGGSYTFTNVTSDHSISVSFAEDNGGGNPPAGTPDYEGAKAGIESRHWAYYGADRSAVLAGFKAELWDLMSHEFAGTFANEAACCAAATISEGTTADTDDFTGHSYYNASVTLFDDTTQANADIVANLRVYVLSSAEECVVKYGSNYQVLNASTADDANKLDVTTRTQGGTASLFDVQFIIGNVNPNAVEIFGNGVMANTMATSDDHAVWHITPPPSLTSLSQLNFILAVYKTGFVGAQITSSNNGGTAAAWDSMGQYPIMSLNSTEEWNVFFGNSSITIGSVALSSLGTVTGVALASGTPTAAAAITSNGSGTWTVTFGSAFYDEVPLAITVNGTAYNLTIRRVGIGIQGIGRGQGDASCTINQGTQPGSTLTWAEGDQYAVVATFYYPKAMFSSKESGSAVADGFGGTYYPWEYTIPNRVSLIVNYVYQDGRTETKIVDTGVLTADSYGYFVPADDFILYKGTRANAPASVYVTAILNSNETTFGGAKLGSGSGVAWTYSEQNGRNDK